MAAATDAAKPSSTLSISVVAPYNPPIANVFDILRDSSSFPVSLSIKTKSASICIWPRPISMALAKALPLSYLVNVSFAKRIGFLLLSLLMNLNRDGLDFVIWLVIRIVILSISFEVIGTSCCLFISIASELYFNNDVWSIGCDIVVIFPFAPAHPIVKTKKTINAATDIRFILSPNILRSIKEVLY